MAWSPDQRSVVSRDGFAWRLVRFSLDASQPPERIEIAGHGAGRLATSASKNRLAFEELVGDTDIYRFDTARPAQVVAASSLEEQSPQLGSDGTRLAFASLRSGERMEIWSAEADGSNPIQLTRGPGQYQGSPRWSPDGRRIAFDSLAEDGYWGIWTIDADGGSLRQLTHDPGDENMPSWSADGRWIYFSSDREGASDVWRIPSSGGPAERVTHSGGTLAFESPDGRTLYFKRSFYDSPLLALPLSGGQERKVADCVPAFGFAVGRAGVYHLACGTTLDAPLFLLDASTGRDRLLGLLERPGFGLTVSPDGETILYTRVVSEGSDLMMIENFR